MYNKNGFNVYVSVFLLIALIFSMLAIYTVSAAESKPGVSAKAAVLYEPSTGVFLFEKCADRRLPMASTTKIMTALVTVECCNLDDRVVIDSRAVGTEGSSAYLRADDEYSVEELLYALLLNSANDAAVALACHISGDVQAFSNLMNDRAAALSLKDTHFENPHGLDSDEHYTTARELAIIAAEAMKNDTLCKIVATYKRTFTEGERTRTYVNHNKLLHLFDGAVGVKTGYTKTSGRCLVGAACRDGLTFITVTLDDPCDWQDHGALFEYGYSQLQRLKLCAAGDFSYTLPVVGGDKDTVAVECEENIGIVTSAGEHEIGSYVKLPRFVTASISVGDVLGKVIFTLDGDRVAEAPLVAKGSVTAKDKTTFFKKILSFFRSE